MMKTEQQHQQQHILQITTAVVRKTKLKKERKPNQQIIYVER